jgi:hypothetical protein
MWSWKSVFPISFRPGGRKNGVIPLMATPPTLPYATPEPRRNKPLVRGLDVPASVGTVPPVLDGTRFKQMGGRFRIAGKPIVGGVVASHRTVRLGVDELFREVGNLDRFWCRLVGLADCRAVDAAPAVAVCCALWRVVSLVYLRLSSSGTRDHVRRDDQPLQWTGPALRSS